MIRIRFAFALFVACLSTPAAAQAAPPIQTLGTAYTGTLIYGDTVLAGYESSQAAIWSLRGGPERVVEFPCLGDEEHGDEAGKVTLFSSVVPAGNAFYVAAYVSTHGPYMTDGELTTDPVAARACADATALVASTGASSGRVLLATTDAGVSWRPLSLLPEDDLEAESALMPATGGGLLYQSETGRIAVGLDGSAGGPATEAPPLWWTRWSGAYARGPFAAKRVGDALSIGGRRVRLNLRVRVRPYGDGADMPALCGIPRRAYLRDVTSAALSEDGRVWWAVSSEWAQARCEGHPPKGATAAYGLRHGSRVQYAVKPVLLRSTSGGRTWKVVRGVTPPPALIGTDGSAPLGQFHGACQDTVLVRRLAGRRWSTIGCRSVVTG
jgi:hypothetical protein